MGEAVSCFIVEGHDTRTGGVWLVSRLVLTLPLPQRRLRRNGWRTGTPGGTTVGWQLAGRDTGIPGECWRNGNASSVGSRFTVGRISDGSGFTSGLRAFAASSAVFRVSGGVTEACCASRACCLVRPSTPPDQKRARFDTEVRSGPRVAITGLTGDSVGRNLSCVSAASRNG